MYFPSLIYSSFALIMLLIRLRDGSIKINQPGYIDKILKEMNMENCDTVQAPIMSTFTREKNRMTTQIEQATGGDTLEEKQHELRKIIRSEERRVGKEC